MKSLYSTQTVPAKAFASAIAVMAAAVPLASASTITPLATENVLTLNGLGQPSFSRVATNGVGGWVLKTSTNPNGGSAGTTATDFYYGSFTRGAGSVLVQEQNQTVNGGTAGNFVSRDLGGTAGLADAAVVAYTQTGRVDNVAPTVTSVWTQTGSTATNVALERNLIPAGPLANQYYGALSGALIARSGAGPYFVGSYSATAGGAQTGVALFSGANGATVLKTGDAVGAETVSNDSGALSGSQFAVSSSGSRYVAVADVIAGTSPTDLLVVTGSTTGTVSATSVRKGSLIGGGNGTETWASFSKVAINDSGTVLVAGSSNNATGDWVVSRNGSVLVRDGNVLPVEGGGTMTVDATSNPEIALNNNGDYATIFGTGITAGGSVLIVDGTIVAKTGTLIDTDGDGVSDATLTYVNSSGGVGLSEVLTGGLLDVYFLGRLNNAADDTLLRYTVTVPEPASLAAVGLLVLGGLRRRTRSI